MPRQQPRSAEARPHGGLRPAPRAERPGVSVELFRKPLRDLAFGPETLIEWLAGEARPVPIDTVDRLVALASSAVEADGAEQLDHLPLAAGLYLRGSGDHEFGAADLIAAADALHTASHALPAAAPATVVAAHRLATLLDEHRGGEATRKRLAEPFGTPGDALFFAAGGAGVLLTASGFATYPGILPPRVLVVGDLPSGFDPGDAVVSVVRSAADAATLTARPQRRITEAAVFLANPRGDRNLATMDALRLRRAFYPYSVGLGETVENVDGTGTPTELAAHLPASMLHLGCGLTPTGALELAAGATYLPATTSAAEGGVALLPPVPADALAEALLDAGFRAVIAFTTEVPARVASLIYFLLHAALVDESRTPAEATHRVRRWLADPDRKPPEYLPADLAALAEDLAPYRDALICHGA